MVLDVDLLEDIDYIELSDDSDDDIQQPSNIEVNEDTFQANHGSYSEGDEDDQDISENEKDCFSPENQHQPSQDDTELFICFKCNLGFKCERHLENYEKIIHNGTKPFKCDSCDKVFAHKNSLKIHKEAHKNKVSSNLERSGVLHHAKKQQSIQTTEKSFKCTICHKTYKQKGYLKLHIQIHRGEKEFTCSICRKTFSSKRSLNVHHRMHSGEKPFKCNICNKAFRQQHHLKSHANALHSRDTGGKRFNLKTHQQTHHENHSASTSKQQLQIHRESHSEVNSFKCTICNKAFTRKTSLLTHKIIHSNKRPFKCTICDKAYKRKDHLKNHNERTGHCAEKPFKRNQNLQTHDRIPDKQKPFECTVCKKAVTSKKNLEIHYRTHSGEKPFKCTICSKDFAAKSNLERHYRIHTRDKPNTNALSQ
ncbi:zinc finger protein 585A [Exaiptasia diaphana]|uniref:Zinc finger protein 865 n=1 Tax=Exaiptasia diaphana TaxID=2652724 RepID=A0A913YM21_EXADI|nr:zinc finger protein 585A [Exaiptasia diaphana]